MNLVVAQILSLYSYLVLFVRLYRWFRRQLPPYCLKFIEMVLMGLRLDDGIDLARLERLSGRQLRETLNAEAIDTFLEEGWLAINESRLYATSEGLQRLNAVLSALLSPLPAAPSTVKELAIDG